MAAGGAFILKRLRGRGSDSEEQISRRLVAAKREIEAAEFYHYWLVNDDLEAAVERFKSILIAERTRRSDRSALRAAFLGANK